MTEANPILAEVLRGDMVESVHRGAAAVVAADGALVSGWGDIERPVYARSAIKPLQALPLVETGAADRFRLSDTEIALACASHNSEPEHVQAVARWLSAIGLSPVDLECGPHLPLSEQATMQLLRAGESPSALHNNCSGKHAGFLTTAVHLDEPTRSYSQGAHPVQQRVRQVLEEMSGSALVDAPAGIDGCGIPVVGLSLKATAFAMARLGDPTTLQPARAQAARRILQAMAAAPFMVAGSRRFCTEVMQRLGTTAVVKVGAEGVFAATLPNKGLGVALKIDDGARRAAVVAIGALLAHLGVLDEADRRALANQLQPPVHDRSGAVVGQVRPAPGWPGELD
ncbi:MAG: asparaginase [Acidiferrobacterales bacterium]